MYITHRIKNQTERKKAHKRVSNILIKKKNSHFGVEVHHSDEKMEKQLLTKSILNKTVDAKDNLPNLNKPKPLQTRFTETKDPNDLQNYRSSEFQRQKPYDLGQESYRKLSNLIKGAYHTYEDGYCDHISLESVDKTRRDFITFSKIYQRISQLNKDNKKHLLNMETQNMNNVVYFNDNKDRLNRRLMKSIRILK